MLKLNIKLNYRALIVQNDHSTAVNLNSSGIFYRDCVRVIHSNSLFVNGQDLKEPSCR